MTFLRNGKYKKKINNKKSISRRKVQFERNITKTVKINEK